MADVLRLARGAHTIDLQGHARIRSAEYTPAAPQLSVTEYTDQIRSGGEITNAVRRNVTESVELLLSANAAGDMSDVQTYIRSIETWLREVDERQRRGVGDRLYVEYEPQDSTGVWRSEILAGRVEVSEILPRWLSQMHVRIVIYWTRRYYWEGAEVELLLSNRNAVTPTTGGVTVDNCYDATHDNTVDIDGDDVDGVIPAPCRIEMTNTYDVSARLAYLFIGHNVFSSPTSFDHILEAEDATGGTPTSSPFASAGYYSQVSVGTTEATVLAWTLPSSLLGHAAGGRFQVLSKWLISLSHDVWLRWRLRYNNLTVWEGEEFQRDPTYALAIRDLGAIQLPPWLVDSGYNVGDLDLELRARRESAGDIYPDFFQLTPTDSYRTLFPVAYGAQYQHRLIDDGILDMVYVDSGESTGRFGYYVPRGSPIMLWPGRNQRLYFLQHAWTMDTAEIDRTMSVRIYHRPRRLTL